MSAWFSTKQSSQSRQLVLLNDVIQPFDNKTSTDVIYLDFSKAFDSVSHHKLLHILNHYKLNKETLDWIADYLAQQCQTTVVDGHFSEYCMVGSGVPQGLDPYCFSYT